MVFFISIKLRSGTQVLFLIFMLIPLRTRVLFIFVSFLLSMLIHFIIPNFLDYRRISYIILHNDHHTYG